MPTEPSEKQRKGSSGDPLHGITLKTILETLVETYDWEGLNERIPLRCFGNDPSLKSSLKFLRKTPWARAKVEQLYLAEQRRVARNRLRNERRAERRRRAAEAAQAGQVAEAGLPAEAGQAAKAGQAAEAGQAAKAGQAAESTEPAES